MIQVDKELLNMMCSHRTENADTIGDYLNLEMTSCEPETGVFTMRCHTTKWMCNFNGTIHGGMCATIVDQAMGVVVHCAKPGKGTCPTVEMNVSYHRPLLPDEDVNIVIKLRSLGKQLIHTASEVYRACEPEKLCLSATAVYFFKSAEETR